MSKIASRAAFLLFTVRRLMSSLDCREEALGGGVVVTSPRLFMDARISVAQRRAEDQQGIVSGFNRSSQQSSGARGVVMSTSKRAQHGPAARHCGRRSIRRSGGGSIACASGRGSLAGSRAKKPPPRRGHRSRSACVGSGRVRACRQSRWPHSRGAACRSSSARRSLSCAPAAAGCARLRAGSRAPSTILRELRRGGGRSPSSTRPTASFAATYRSASPAPSSDSTGRPSQGRGSSGTAGVAAAARTVARRGRRVPSRSPTGGVWTTGTIRRCASRKDWTSICYQVHKTVSRGPDELKKCPRSASIVASGRTVF